MPQWTCAVPTARASASKPKKRVTRTITTGLQRLVIQRVPERGASTLSQRLRASVWSAASHNSFESGSVSSTSWGSKPARDGRHSPSVAGGGNTGNHLRHGSWPYRGIRQGRRPDDASPGRLRSHGRSASATTACDFAADETAASAEMANKLGTGSTPSSELMQVAISQRKARATIVQKRWGKNSPRSTAIVRTCD